MLPWLPSIPYPPPDQPGYWEPVTSTIQWCEEDYYLTYYSAEIINTLTNLMFIYLSYKGIRMCLKQDHDTVFSVAYFGYFLVGVGSFMFHTSLKYPWQLVDELNMIYTTCLMAYVSLSYSRSTYVQVALGVFLSLVCAGITVYYHYLQDPAFHQTVYAALTVFIVFRSVFIMETSLRPKFRKSREQDRQYRKEHILPRLPSKERLAYENDRDMATLNTMWIFVAFGVSIFLGGFALWGVDNVHCSRLRRWRRQVGMPWGFFLEGHGWWHLMTGVGAYCYIVWAIHLRHILDGNQEDYEMTWPHFWTLPEVVRRRKSSERGKTARKVEANGGPVNGHLKKSQ